MLSPDPAPYEAHGFLPLCFVPAVGEYAKDYFSVSADQKTAPMEASFEGFESPILNANSAPMPGFPSYMHTSHLSLDELAHPTGSPVQEGDLTPLPTRSLDFEHKAVSVLRGGGGEYFYEKEQEGCEEICEEAEHRQNVSLNDLALRTTTPGDPEQTSYTYLPRATSMTERKTQDADKSAEAEETSNNGGDRVRSAATVHRTTDSAGSTREFPSSNADIERLLKEIAAVFPNASLKFANSEAHASKVDEKYNTPSMNSDDSSAGAEEILSTSSPRQSESDQRILLNDNSLENQPLPLLDFDSIPPSATMDDPELIKILLKPISPRPPSTSSSSRRRKKKPYKSLSPISNNPRGLFDIVQRSTAKELALCRCGLKVDIVNATTREIYVRKVPMRMLWHLCGAAVLERLADEERVDVLKIPTEEAEKSGIARVVRYMRRACAAPIVRPTGELRIPGFSISAGIETIRACRVFGLEADAQRIEELIVHSWMHNKEWYMTDEHVELTWEGYHGLLRETALGDAIVWFVLNEVQNGTHPLAEEIRWMLGQEEYESLKERVHDENSDVRKRWRHESRRQYLERCRAEREQKQRKEEERTGVRPRSRKEPRRLSPDVEQTKTNDSGSERHRNSETMFSGLLDEEESDSDAPPLDVSQTSSLRRHSSNSRAGADTPRPMSLAETDSGTEDPPQSIGASGGPIGEQPGLWSQCQSHDPRGKPWEALTGTSPKPKLSLLRRLEARIDR
jgi:hypothetical protein